MDLIEKKLATLENEKNQVNNGPAVLGKVSSDIKSRIFAAINSANESESIDGRIQALVEGMQGIIDHLNNFEEQFLRTNFIIDNKITVLEEVLDEYISTHNE